MFSFLFASILFVTPEVTPQTAVNFPDHIEKGEQLYVRETPETLPLPEHVWYRQAFCGNDPSCDRVASIFPAQLLSRCPDPEEPEPVPEPGTALLLLPGMAGVWWWRRQSARRRTHGI